MFRAYKVVLSQLLNDGYPCTAALMSVYYVVSPHVVVFENVCRASPRCFHVAASTCVPFVCSYPHPGVHLLYFILQVHLSSVKRDTCPTYFHPLILCP
jgi:hypothetical protein